MSDHDDFFAMLDAEIAVANKAAKMKADREAARKKANNRHASAEARAAAKARFLDLDAQLAAQEWTPIKTIALFSEQRCDGCGSVHHVFLQYMECHELIRKPSTLRWVRVTKPDTDLPREAMIQPMLTHICPSCCEEHGFSLASNPRQLALRKQAIAPSTTYIQEDINAPSA